MGVNICVMNADEIEHPGWDWTRYAGDREFAYLDLPRQELATGGDFNLWRPVDFAAWRAATAKFHNPERFAGLLDLLEADPTQWIHLSW